MTLEVFIENKAVDLIERKYRVKGLKYGRNGWPDRVFPLGKDCPGGVIWIEFKQPGEALKPNQVIRHRQLAQMGQRAVVCTSVREAEGEFAKARRAYQRARDRSV